MRRIAWLVLLAGCDPLPATGDPLSPVRPSAPVAAGPSRPAPTGFDFEADEAPPPQPASEDDEDLTALLARAQGKPPPAPMPVASPTPAPAPAPIADAPVPAPAAPTLWDPASAPSTDWGVHLLSTLHDTQPPLAVLGMPDGTRRVHQAGDMLADRQLVVMAVGREVVQIARIVPDGYQARIESRTISSLFPASGRSDNR